MKRIDGAAPDDGTAASGPEAGWLTEFGRPLLWVGAYSCGRNLLALVPALCVAPIFDRIAAGRGWTGSLAAPAVLATLAFAASLLLDAMRTRVLHRLANMLEAKFAAAQMHRAVAPQGAEGARPAAALVGRDLEILRRFADGPAPPAWLDIAFVPLIVLAIFWLNIWLGMAALAGLGLQASVLSLSLRAAPAEMPEAAADAYAFGDAITRHADCASTMGLGLALASRWQKLRSVLAEADRAGGGWGAGLPSANAACAAACPAAILGLGALMAQQHQLGFGAVLAAFLLARQAAQPVNIATVHLRPAKAAWDALGRLRVGIREPAGTSMLPQARGELVLEGVTWTPPGALRPALRGITLKIEAGAVLAIIGPSAAGKSSLARVLAGALRPAQGVVRLDGIELGQWTESQRGGAIGYLPQDVALFPGTLSENIARFSRATEFQIGTAARMAGVHDMITQLPQGYRTRVEDQAGLLSAGQRQRVALARALLGDPPVLVLDEPDASLDAEGEAALIACMIEARRRRRTVIMITHNTGLVRVADFVATMVGGHVMKVQRTSDVLGRPAMLAATG